MKDKSSILKTDPRNSASDPSCFFDFNAFLIHILRHISLCLFLVVVLGCLGFFITFIPSFKSYLNYTEDTSISQNTSVADDYPYIYTACKIIYLPAENSIEILKSALALFKSDTMMTSLQNEFYKDALSTEYKLRNRMVTYNYRLQTVLESPYSAGDFNRILDCYISPAYSVIPNGHSNMSLSAPDSNHFLVVSASTGDESLSSSMCDRCVELLINEVSSLLGSFEYKLIDRATDITLPSPESGLIPITSIGSVITTERPQLSSIIKRSLKSAVWGIIIAFFGAVFIGFFIEVTSEKLISTAETRLFHIPILASVEKTGNRPLFHPFCRLIDSLEGKERSCPDLDTAVQVSEAYLQKYISNDSSISKILITGSVSTDKLKDICTTFKNYSSNQINYLYSPFISGSPETVTLADDHTLVLLIEELNVTTKANYHFEIQQFELLKSPIAGTLLLK